MKYEWVGDVTYNSGDNVYQSFQGGSNIQSLLDWLHERETAEVIMISDSEVIEAGSTYITRWKLYPYEEADEDYWPIGNDVWDTPWVKNPKIKRRW